MSEPKNFSTEKWLNFAQAYMDSAIMLVSQYGKEPLMGTFIDCSNSYFLCSHFLASHSIELYLKFFLQLLDRDHEPIKQHDLLKLTEKVNKLLEKKYNAAILNRAEMEFIKYLNRYEKFRYPALKDWKIIREIFTEAKKWNKTSAKTFSKKCTEIQNILHDCGYKISMHQKMEDTMYNTGYPIRELNKII